MGYLNPKQSQSSQKSFLLISFSVFVIMLIWVVTTNIYGVDEVIFPKLSQVVANVFTLLVHGDILIDISISLLRVLIGFGLAVVIGIPLGILCGVYKPISTLIETHLNFLRFIPAASMIPLLILWFGVGEVGKIVLITLRALPYLVLYISTAASNVEKEYLEMGSVLGANHKQLITTVVFPYISPKIWDICRIEFGSSWSTVILAEVLAANSGIGYRLVLAQRYVHTTELFALILISAFVALLIDLLFRLGHKKFFPWSEQSRLIEI